MIFDFFHDRKGVLSRLSIDRDVDLLAPVDVDHVGLNLMRVLDFPDIPHEDDRAVDRLDRHVVELFDAFGHRVGDDLIVKVADLHVARRHKDTLLTERSHDVHRRQVSRFELHGVHIRVNATKHAAVYRGSDHTSNALKIVPQVIVGHVVKFLFRHRGTGNGHQAQRHRGRRIKRHHHRRDRARRQVEHVGHGVRRHLRHGRFETDPVPKEVLDDAHTEHRLALLTLDTHGLPRPPLHPAHDVTFHHFRRHARVKRDDLHTRGLKLRQKVRRNLYHGCDTHDDHSQNGHHDEMRIL